MQGPNKWSQPDPNASRRKATGRQCFSVAEFLKCLARDDMSSRAQVISSRAQNLLQLIPSTLLQIVMYYMCLDMEKVGVLLYAPGRGRRGCAVWIFKLLRSRAGTFPRNGPWSPLTQMAQLSLCTWLLWPLFLRLVDLDVLLKAEPAGGRERQTGTLCLAGKVGGSAGSPGSSLKSCPSRERRREAG